MRAVVITRPGDPSVLAIQDVAMPRPADGEIRVRVTAFGVNRADLFQRRGHYPAPPGSPADIPGLEFAGRIDALGPGTTRFGVGDRVMGIAGGGTCAEYVVVPEGQAMRIPEDMADATAAAIPEAFVTAHDALQRAELKTGEWILITAVGSGVGLAALQLARSRGARVGGTSRTAEKLARAAELGLDVGVDTTSQNVVTAVRAAAGGAGVNAMVDLVGGTLLPQTLQCLAPQGRVVIVGLMAGRAAELDLSVILTRRLRLEGTVLRSRSKEEKAAAVAAFATDVMPLLVSGTVRPVIHAILSFEEVAQAHRLLEANATFGKVVVEVEAAGA